MKKILVAFLLLIATLTYSQVLVSPNGKLQLRFTLDNGIPKYELNYKNKAVITSSKLGIEAEGLSLADGFAVTDTARTAFNQTWNPVWGNYKSVRNQYNELLVQLTQKSQYNRVLVVRFRLFDDGLGFRYEFPEQRNLNYFTILDEMTEFNLTGDHTAFCMPGDYDTNEFPYTTAPLSEIKTKMARATQIKPAETFAPGLTVQTPLMLKSKDGLYINIHEAALVHYSAMLLNVNDKAFSLTAHLTPDKLGKKGYLQVPCQSPWRTVIVSDDARDILASQTILNLNEPTKFEDTSWIKPMKFVGVWWEMFIGTDKTWAYSDYYSAKPGVTDYSKLTPNKRHPANTANVKKYIDFAAANGIQGVLVEGWNEGWEDWGSYRKDKQFEFSKPYPDFNMVELRDYAAQKGVQIIMHHETASNAADYDKEMDKAFDYMNANGYKSVKTGYVGYIIPRSEYHSSQWMNDHYIHVVERAAEKKIMVDSHEAVRPTGLCRTYPNWVAQESARGTEFESMGGNDPDHTTILPFTRLMGGPMDYTPGIFQGDLSYYKGSKNDQKVHTTLVKQLALYLTMSSPLQMAADLPENYERFKDAFQFIKDVAVDWDNSWYLEAEPGDYITVARKAKGKDEWFLGAITDENPRTATISFSFLPEGKKYTVTVYEDGKDASWDKNPQSYQIRNIVVTSKTVLKQKLASSGGAAMTIRSSAK
jgi:hypothetical protein